MTELIQIIFFSILTGLFIALAQTPYAEIYYLPAGICFGGIIIIICDYLDMKEAEKEAVIILEENLKDYWNSRL